MRVKHRIFARDQLQEKNAVLLKRSFFAGALNRSNFTRQDRPLSRPVLKLSNGVDEQDGFVRSCLVQHRYGDFYTQLS